MGTRYYRPGERRGGTRIVPTKKFFLLIAAVAAIIVVIVLLVTLIPASEQDKTITDLAQSEKTEIVSATEQESGQEETGDVEEVSPEEMPVLPETEEEVTTEEPVSETEPVKETTSYDTLQDGSTGDQVTKLQNRLIELGYLEAENNTGKFGPMTEEAVKKFQSNNNLQADGIAGAKTQEILFSDSAKSE